MHVIGRPVYVGPRAYIILYKRIVSSPEREISYCTVEVRGVNLLLLLLGAVALHLLATSVKLLHSSGCLLHVKK